jgi:hypothetical protein
MRQSRGAVMADSKNLYQRLLEITLEIGKIEKTGRNQQQGYAFIEQSQVVAELRPLLHKYGVMIMPETLSRTVERFDVTRGNGKPGVDVHAHVISQYTIVNADKPDDYMICRWDAGEALDTSDKASNKAVTASNKSFLMKLFNISDKDDPDQETVPASPKPQLAKPVEPAQPDLTLPPKGTEITDGQLKRMMAHFNEMGVTDRDERLAYVTAITRRTIVSSRELTRGEAVKVIDKQLHDIAEKEGN